VGGAGEVTDPLITDTLSAGDTFSKELTVTDYDFAVAVWGTFNGTLTLQMQPQWRDVTFDWIDVATYDKDGACEVRPVVKGTCLVRIGFKTGDYTSGDANVALYRGEDSAQRVYVTKRLK
jgi:hypothetical protein